MTKPQTSSHVSGRTTTNQPRRAYHTAIGDMGYASTVVASSMSIHKHMCTNDELTFGLAILELQTW